MREQTLNLILAIAVVVFSFTAVNAEVLRTVEVTAPAINCLFDPACRVEVNDTTDIIPIGAGGSNFLQSRTFRGRPGSPAAGLYVYEYRIDLRRATGILHIPCIEALSLDFGPVVQTLDFNGDGERGDEVFVITRGGLGSIGLASADKSGNTITFRFSDTVCAGGRPGEGESTFFFGLVSTHSPANSTATVFETHGITHEVTVRTPRAKDPIHDPIQRGVPIQKRKPVPDARDVNLPQLVPLRFQSGNHSVKVRLPQPQGGCPPAGQDPGAANLLRNPSFEEVGPRGRIANLFGRDGGIDTRSAAADWTMHTSNDQAKVTTEVVKSNRLGGGATMLHITAGSNEGGVYQLFDQDNRGPKLVVASVWVFVKRGRVVLATGNQGFTPTSALSTTTGTWELLQACSDGTTTNNWFVVYSTAVDGSDFYVDSAKVSKANTQTDKCGGMMIEGIVPNVAFPGGVIAINGSGFGHRQGQKIPAINRGHVNRLQVTSWTDTQILARVPLDLVGGTYRVLIYCNDTYRTSSNSLEVVVRDDLRRPR